MSKSWKDVKKYLLDQVGYIEKADNNNLDEKTANKGSSNYTKYSRDINSVGLMGCQGQPWCILMQFASDLKVFGKDEALKLWNMTQDSYVGYNCFATYNKFNEVGKVAKIPKESALVIFTFSHAGRVMSVYEENGVTYFDCLEGNTSSNLNDRNGGMVVVKKRRIDDPTIKGFLYIDYSDEIDVVQNKSGWIKEENEWRFYLGNTGEYVKENWYLNTNGKWSYFDGNGYAIHHNWFKYKNLWYYFGDDCYAISSKWTLYKDKHYYLTEDCSMATNCYIKSKDPGDDNYYFVGSDGTWDGVMASNPDLNNYKIVE